MESKWSGLREIQEGVYPSRSPMEIKIAYLEEDVADIKQTLNGAKDTKHRKALQVELTNKEQELLHMKRRAIGRTPQMDSWGDPLP